MQQKKTILCVDDDPAVTEWLEVVLTGAGYNVISAGTAEEGMKKYRQSPPDLLIVDLMMEEVDAGTSLVRELKAEANKAPVYMLSSVGDELNVTTDSSDLGLAGIFQKPIDPDILLRVIKGKLGS